MDSQVSVATIPRPITPGVEMEALRRFYPDITWTGTIEAGGMGPGSPAMNATGSGTHELIQDGLWIAGNYEQDQFLNDGTFVLKWRLHWVAGWDPGNGEYRATFVDNYGHAGVMSGRIEGSRLIFESMGEQPIRVQLVWDLSDPKGMTWRNRVSVGESAWSLVEEYRCTPFVP